jgi:hypothetical protein
MAKHTANRSHILREVDGIRASSETLRLAVTSVIASRAQNNHPTIETAALHRHIAKLDEHLQQLKTLTNFRSTP